MRRAPVHHELPSWGATATFSAPIERQQQLMRSEPDYDELFASVPTRFHQIEGGSGVVTPGGDASASKLAWWGICSVDLHGKRGPSQNIRLVRRASLSFRDGASRERKSSPTRILWAGRVERVDKICKDSSARTSRSAGERVRPSTRSRSGTSTSCCSLGGAAPPATSTPRPGACAIRLDQHGPHLETQVCDNVLARDGSMSVLVGRRPGLVDVPMAQLSLQEVSCGATPRTRLLAQPRRTRRAALDNLGLQHRTRTITDGVRACVQHPRPSPSQSPKSSSSSPSRRTRRSRRSVCCGSGSISISGGLAGSTAVGTGRRSSGAAARAPR